MINLYVIKNGETRKPTGLKKWWPRTSREHIFRSFSAFGCLFFVEEIFEHSDVEAADVSEKPLGHSETGAARYTTATERK